MIFLQLRVPKCFIPFTLQECTNLLYSLKDMLEKINQHLLATTPKFKSTAVLKTFQVPLFIY